MKASASTPRTQQDRRRGRCRASSATTSPTATRRAAARRWRTFCRRTRDINVVYTINEPAAAGAYEALKAVGKEKNVLIVSVDGGCPGVKNVEGRRHRRHLAAVSAADGLALGIEAIKPSSPRRHQAEADRRQGLLRHRRDADHRQAGRRRRLDRRQGRHRQVLGLIRRPAECDGRSRDL
jgi:hypothetical protein